jgi:hypothetical protein
MAAEPEMTDPLEPIQPGPIEAPGAEITRQVDTCQIEGAERSSFVPLPGMHLRLDGECACANSSVAASLEPFVVPGGGILVVVKLERQPAG